MDAPEVAAAVPAWLPVVSALAGTAVGGILGWVGTWLQSKHQHRQWLNERRYDAYVRAQSLIWRISNVSTVLRELSEQIRSGSGDPSEAPRLRAELAKLDAQIDVLTAEVADAFVPLDLLGPDSVSHLRDDLARMARREPDKLGKELEKFVRHARKALRVRA